MAAKVGRAVVSATHSWYAKGLLVTVAFSSQWATVHKYPPMSSSSKTREGVKVVLGFAGGYLFRTREGSV